jgi:hypothetical protein
VVFIDKYFILSPRASTGSRCGNTTSGGSSRRAGCRANTNSTNTCDVIPSGATICDAN